MKTIVMLCCALMLLAGPAHGQYPGPQPDTPRAAVCCAPEGVINYPNVRSLFPELAASIMINCITMPGQDFLPNSQISLSDVSPCVLPTNVGQRCRIPHDIYQLLTYDPTMMFDTYSFGPPLNWIPTFEGISCDNGQNCSSCVRSRRVCRTPVGDFTDPSFYGAQIGSGCIVNHQRGSFRGEVAVPQ